jgi:hypothetical protein
MELDEMLSSYDDDVLLLKKGQSNLKMSIWLCRKQASSL